MRNLFLSLCVIVMSMGSIFAYELSVEDQTRLDLVAERLEVVDSASPEKLNSYGLRLMAKKSFYAQGSDSYVLLDTILDMIYAIQHRVTAPTGYPIMEQEMIDLIEISFHFQGNEGVPIQVVEFADFQCPYCQKQAKSGLLEEIRTYYPHTTRTAFGHFPLGGTYHVLAEGAAVADECIYTQVGEEGFYRFKDISYRTSLQPTVTRMMSYTSQIAGVDVEEFSACLENEDTLERVQLNKNIGVQLGVRGTPYTTIIDTRSGAFITLGGVQSLERIHQHINVFLAQK